jgi:hypothetical protein
MADSVSTRRRDTPPWWYDDPIPEEEDCDQFEWADTTPNAEEALIAAEFFLGDRIVLRLLGRDSRDGR